MIILGTLYTAAVAKYTIFSDETGSKNTLSFSKF